MFGNKNIHNWRKFILSKPWVSLLIYMSVTAVVYLQASSFPMFSPLVIQPWSVDESLPFLPSYAYLYVSYFFLFPALILLTSKCEGFEGVYAAGLLCGLINVAIFSLFPTMLAERIDAPQGSLLSTIQFLDTTLCAFPSGHVSLPTSIAVAAYLIREKTLPANRGIWRKVFYGYAIWTAVIAISALLIGQHYIVDVFGGVIFGSGVACGVYLLSNVNRRTLFAIVKEWLLIVSVLIVAVYANSIIVYIIAGLIVSTRQHALLILFHDAVHGLVAKSKRINDLVINATVGVPLMLPVQAYRAIHICHHKHVGTDKDPERLLLYWRQPWNYQPLKTTSLVLQFLGDISGFNSLVMLSRYAMMNLTGNKRDQFTMRIYLEFLLMSACFISGIVVSFLVWPDVTVTVLLLWFLPYLTFTQLLQKVRSFAEHSMDESHDFTYNWRPSFIGKLTIWPYNINYHRAHHAHSNVPWHQLPSYSDSRVERPAIELIPHVWTGKVL